MAQHMKEPCPFIVNDKIENGISVGGIVSIDGAGVGIIHLVHIGMIIIAAVFHFII